MMHRLYACGASIRVRYYEGMARRWSALAVLMFVLIACGQRGFAYSLITHEQLVDLAWDDSIVPLLLSRYPGLTPAQLDRARAYAYGGCVIQDIGYYPFGDTSFSNLTHYVRPGDFVVNLFRNAHNANELAFAVGALSHYIGDTIGHPMATNVAVPVEFPDLKAKYGSVVNYAEGRHQHVQTEFGFDIDEIAHHRTAPLRYLRHIGLQVSMKQLGLTFYQTYGLQENFSGTRGRRVNVKAYRFAVRAFIPRVAYAVTLLHRHNEPPDSTSPEAVELHKEIAEVAAANHWDAYRHHAGIGTWTLAGLIYIMPKVGPLKLAAVRGPSADTEADYAHSVMLSTERLRRVLARFTPPSARLRRVAAYEDERDLEHTQLPQMSRDPLHPLPNRDLDTGTMVKPGGYPLTDSTFASLLHILTRQPNQPIPPGVKAEIEQYYADLNAPFATKKDPRRWTQVQEDLAILKDMPTSTELPAFPTYDVPDEGGQ